MSIPNQPVNPFSAHATQEVDLQQPGPVYQGYPQNDQSFHQGMTCQSKKPRSAASGFATFFVVIGFVIMLSPVLSAIFVGMIPGDHGDSGDALGWLPVLFLFWVAPWGLLMVIIGGIIAILDTSLRDDRIGGHAQRRPGQRRLTRTKHMGAATQRVAAPRGARKPQSISARR